MLKLLPLLLFLTLRDLVFLTGVLQCFANLVRLMPLDDGVSGLSELFSKDEELRTKAQKQRGFIDQLLNANHAENYKVRF